MVVNNPLNAAITHTLQPVVDEQLPRANAVGDPAAVFMHFLKGVNSGHFLKEVNSGRFLKNR